MLTPDEGELDDISQFVMLTAHEGSRLFDLLGDPVYPNFGEHSAELRRTECARAIRKLLERGWLTLLRDQRDRRGSTAATEPFASGEVEGILSAPEFWDYESALQQKFFVAIETTDAGERALKEGVARDAFDRMYEKMKRDFPGSDPTAR